LRNGVEIPLVGFGCAFGNWTNVHTGSDAPQGFFPEESWLPLAKAVRAGFTHFDGAYIYGSHRHLGVTLGNAYATEKLKRSDVFITTKVYHMPAPIALKDKYVEMDQLTDPDELKKKIHEQFEKSLDELGHGYVDLLLMHWPGVGEDGARNRKQRKAVWEAFQEIYESKKARAIGVSNFTKRHLEEMIGDTGFVPMVNQIEISPYITQKEIVDFCKEKEIVLEAWAPFGSGATGVLSEPRLAELGKKYNKNAGQIVLRWLTQQGIVALPKSSNEDRMRANLNIFDFKLTDEELAEIWAMNKNKSSVMTAENIA